MPGEFRGALEVVARAGGNIPEDEFLGNAPAEEHVQPVEELGLPEEVAVLGGSCCV